MAITINSNPTPPSRSKIGRYSGGDTSAYVPNCLLNLSEENSKLKVENIFVYSKPSTALIKALEDDLCTHIAVRIQLFCQQLLLVYQSKLELEKYGTDRTKQTGKGTGDYEAAHSSTLPTLAFKKENQLCRFVKDSFFEHTQGATILLPTTVNNVDSYLDSSLKFRNIALCILNHVSQGAQDPKTGLVRFINQLISLLARLKEKLPSELEEARLNIKRLNGLEFSVDGVPNPKTKIEDADSVNVLHQRGIIFDCYQTTANSFLSALEDSETGMKRLCFTQEVTVLDNRFYLDVQKQMYKLLGQETDTQPIIQQIVAGKQAPQRTLPYDPDDEKENTSLGASACEAFCNGNPEIQKLFKEYLENVNPQDRENDERQLFPPEKEKFELPSNFLRKDYNPYSQGMQKINDYVSTQTKLKPGSRKFGPFMSSLISHLLKNSN